MRGDQTVIQHLNAVLKTELTAINQYLLHARLLKHWGVSKLGAYEHQQSLEETKDADELVTGSVATFASSAREIVSLAACAAARSTCGLPVATPWFVIRNVSTSPTVCCALAVRADAAQSAAHPIITPNRFMTSITRLF